MATNPMYTEQEKPFDRIVEQDSSADQRQAAMLGKYPLLEAVLSAKGLPIKGVWTIADVADIFGVGRRAIYDWIGDANRKLAARDLPGHGKFLSEDLEEFLRNSKKVPKERYGSGRLQ